MRHVTIPTHDETLLARVYVPEGDGPLPVLVYFQGGGWVIGNLSSNDGSARALANASGHIVVSVAYRKAPEVPFPGPAEDAWKAYNWTVFNAAAIGGDPIRVSVADRLGGTRRNPIRDQRAPPQRALVTNEPR